MAYLDKNDMRAITYTVSNIMSMLGITIIIPAIAAVLLNDHYHALVFALIAATTTICFSIIKKLTGKQRVCFRHAMLAIMISWFVVGILSAIPFIINNMSIEDAIFESISGWTGTGLSLILKPENIPIALNFWRAFIQWIGGFGIVMTALLIYEKPETAQRLFMAEGRLEDFLPNISKIARIMLIIYFMYSFFGIFLLLFSGMNLFDAIFHSFTSIATGGFSTTSSGVGGFGIGPMISIMIIMLIGGISFESHYSLIKGNFKKFFSNPEIRLLFGLIIGATIIISLSFFLAGKNNYFDALFFVVSAITSTGASPVMSITQLTSIGIFVLIILMTFGACYGSTTGAIKLWRTVILLKVIKREIYKAFLPQKVVIPIKIGNKILNDEESLKAISYIVLYIFLMLVGSILLMLFGYGIIESVFTIASIQGNNGLTLIPISEIIQMPLILKLLLSVHMIVGRVEIIPFLVLFKALGVGKRI